MMLLVDSIIVLWTKLPIVLVRYVKGYSYYELHTFVLISCSFSCPFDKYQ